MIRNGSLEAAVDRPRNLDAPASVATDVVGERREEMIVDPLADELIPGAKAEHAVGQAVELNS